MKQKAFSLLTALIVGITAYSAYAKPVLILPTDMAVWNEAKTTSVHATLQIGFRTDLFNRYQDILSSVIWELPSRFPDFERAPVTWGLHSTLLESESFSIDDARTLLQFFESLDERTLREHQLLGAFTVVDPRNIEIVVTGPIGNRSLALRPHAEFIGWHERFHSLLEERIPGLKASHGDVNIPILTWRESDTAPRTLLDIERARSALSELLIQTAKKIPVQVTFDSKTAPIQLVAGGLHSELGPTTLMTFKSDTKNKMRASPVAAWIAWVSERWKTQDKTTKTRTLIELNSEKLRDGDPQPYQPVETEGNDWYRSYRFFEKMDIAQFIALLPPPLQAAFERELTYIRTYKRPAALGNDLFVTHKAYPSIQPEKALPLIGKFSELAIKSTDRVSMGLALYGSTTKREIKNPADSDLLLNSLVHVPDSIADLKQAEAFARKAFIEESIGHLVNLAKQGKISFTELRIGSDFTMGIDVNNPDLMGRYERNPYLSQQDVIAGKYQDKNGRTWTLDELVALGDFMKAKIDLFPAGSQDRVPLSLQFFLGFEWKGKIHFLRRNGLKGAHSTLMQTGVYFGAESYAIAATLDRTISYYVGQRGQNGARAIGEMLSIAYPDSSAGTSFLALEPQWRSKFLKRFYSFLIVLRRRNGGGMDEIFFDETKRILQREGKWDPQMSLITIVRQIMRAVNRPELKTLAGLKDIANDFAEFNERKQEFTADQWRVRFQELDELIPQLERMIAEERMLKPDSAFYGSLKAFTTLIAEARNSQRVSALDRKTVLEFKHQLELEEARFNSDSRYEGALPQSHKDFISTMVALAPHFYSRYVKARAAPSERTMRLIYRLMGIDPTDKKLASMDLLDERLDELSRSELAKVQAGIFGFSCEQILSQRNLKVNF